MTDLTTTSWLWNGKEFTPCDTIPVADRGFRYGMAVFESLPVRQNTPFFLPQHYDRLHHACFTTGLETPLPPLVDLDALLRCIVFDAFVRIYVTAGDGGVAAGTKQGRVFVFVEPRSVEPSLLDDFVYKIAIHPDPHAPVFEGLKTANYWANIAALQCARKEKFDEALLFSAKGHLISACMANAFIVKRGKIRTPHTMRGARAGVVREWVLGRQMVEECRISREDLLAADEIFLTSSWLGVMPVASLEGRELSSRDVALQLRVEYEREISEVCKSGQTF